MSKLPKNMVIMEMLDKCGKSSGAPGKRENLLTQKGIRHFTDVNDVTKIVTEVRELRLC